MAKKGVQHNHPLKAMPQPADLRALGSYAGTIMQAIRSEHYSMLSRMKQKRRG